MRSVWEIMGRFPQKGSACFLREPDALTCAFRRGSSSEGSCVHTCSIPGTRSSHGLPRIPGNWLESRQRVKANPPRTPAPGPPLSGRWIGSPMSVCILIYACVLVAGVGGVEGSTGEGRRLAEGFVISAFERNMGTGQKS